MADTVIDTLQVKVTANAQTATKALRELSSALNRVRNALTGVKDGATVADHLSKSLTEVNNALRGISNTSIGKLDRLSTALQRYANATRALRGTSRLNIGKSIRDAGRAVRESEATSTGSSDSVDSERTARRILSLGVNVDALREKLRAATGATNGFFRAIGRIALYRAIRSAIKAVTEAFSEGLKNAYYFSQQNEGFSRLAVTMDRIKSITSQMVNQLGAMWGEIQQFILPAVEWLVEKVRSIAETLTELFAALNGEDRYLRAKYEELKWDDAVDSLKEYKHQLLGLDELNNLSKQKDNSKPDAVKAAKDAYDIMPVSAKFKQIGTAWNGIKSILSQTMDDIENIVIGAEIGIGAVLLFSGASIPLGLGLLVHGTWKGVKKLKEEWGSVNTTTEGKLAELSEIVGGALFGIGVVLALTGNVGLGIGAMVLGATSFGIGAKKRNWDKLPNRVQKELDEFIIRTSAAELAIGAILCLSGVSIGAGIPLMAAGAIGLWHESTEGNINWAELPETVRGKLIEYFGLGGLLAVSAALVAIGALLAFACKAPGHLGLGIALLATGVAGLGFAAASTDWEATGKAIQDALVNAFGTGGLIAFGAGLLAIGALLCFSTPAHMALGIAMIAAGGGSLALGISSIDWDCVLKNLKEAFARI